MMVEIENLTKRYGGFTALDNVNLHIGKGDIFGLVGPNGAGKTTIMRIMCGLLNATSGSVLIDGADVLRRPADVKKKIGYVPDFFGVYDNFRVMEYMEFYGSLYGMSRAETDEVTERLLQLVNLSDKKDLFVDSLSRGMKQRLCVARALIHDPELLVLDEPNSGLDPRARYEMKEVLKKLGAAGKTIVISSHILPELAELCTGIGIIESGRVVTSGCVEEVMSHGHGMPPVRISGFVLGMSDADSAAKISAIIRERFSVDKISIEDNEVIVNYAGNRETDSEMLRSLVDGGVHVHRFVRDRKNLESLFLEITGGDGDE